MRASQGEPSAVQWIERGPLWTARIPSPEHVEQSAALKGSASLVLTPDTWRCPWLRFCGRPPGKRKRGTPSVTPRQWLGEHRRLWTIVRSLASPLCLLRQD